MVLDGLFLQIDFICEWAFGQSSVVLIVRLGPLKEEAFDIHASSCRFFKKE